MLNKYEQTMQGYKDEGMFILWFKHNPYTGYIVAEHAWDRKKYGDK